MSLQTAGTSPPFFYLSKFLGACRCHVPAQARDLRALQEARMGLFRHRIAMRACACLSPWAQVPGSMSLPRSGALSGMRGLFLLYSCRVPELFWRIQDLRAIQEVRMGLFGHWIATRACACWSTAPHHHGQKPSLEMDRRLGWPNPIPWQRETKPDTSCLLGNPFLNS